MRHYILRRVGYSVLSLFLLSLTIFFFVRVTGDPATLLVEPGASEADIAAIHHQFRAHTNIEQMMGARALRVVVPRPEGIEITNHIGIFILHDEDLGPHSMAEP